MIIWHKILLFIALIAVLVGLVMFYGNAREETGRLEERTAQQDANIAWRQEFDRDRAAGALRVAKAEANIREARKQTDAKIAEMLQRDETLRDWHNRKIPAAFADIIWMRDKPVRSLPGGPELD